MLYSEYQGPAQEMQKAAAKFYALRYQMSNGGNLSVRLPGRDLMLVKGTDVAFDEVGPETLGVRGRYPSFQGGAASRRHLQSVRGSQCDYALPLPLCDGLGCRAR